MGKTPRIVRSPRQPALNFAIQKVNPWNTNALAVGLTVPIANDYATKVTKANDANMVVLDLRQQLKGAIDDANDKFREMSLALTECVRRIDLFAQNQADPMATYLLAAIDPPTSPSQMPAPGTPGSFKAQLNPDGSVKVSWKCTNPEGSSGTVYIVRRKLNGATNWEQVAITGRKFFVDATIPASSGGAQYTVQAQRVNVLGQQSAPFTLQFGIDGGGNFAITGATEGTKLAA